MSVQPFLIANTEVGLERDMEPWILPDTAFPTIEDAYVWRKRIKRRQGNEFLGRLSEQKEQIFPLAVTAVDITWTGTLSNVPIRPFSILIEINADVFVDDGAGNMVGSGTGVVNYLTGVVTLDFAAIGGAGPYNVDAFYAFYPNLPAMGLCTREDILINEEDLIGFNTTKANIWNTATDFFDDISFYDHSGQPIIWTGQDFNFFDYENFQGAFFATNNTPGYHIEVIASTAKGVTTTFTLANNIVDVGDTIFVKNLVPVAPDTAKTLENLNDHSFLVTAATQTTITIAYDSSAFANNPTGGVIFMPQHSGYDVAQFVTAVAPGATTVITFAANNFQLGDHVYIKWMSGTIVPVLNGKVFTVLNSVPGVGGTITIDANTTGLVWGGATGLVVRPVGDGIRWYAQDSSVNGWVNFNPTLNDANSLKGGRILLGYKDRLVILSTFEGPPNNTSNTNYTNRARWSQNGTVFNETPVPQNQTADPQAWRDDIPGRGGFIDAPTTEAIISADFIRDTLVVFFERTTWALRYTGDQALPFVWVRINIEFGSGSQFSSVPFDRGVLTVGNRGIITSDGNNVERIDLKIPDTVFDISISNNNNARVHGIRDYRNELVYWTYINRADSANEAGVINTLGVSFPNKLLVYNYRENSYSIFNDAYTCFGYFTKGKALLWNTAKITWNNANFNWNSAQIAANFPDIVAGTNTGYVMVLNKADSNDNQIAIDNIVSIGLQTLVTTKEKHNLLEDQFVSFDGVQGMVNINGLNSQIVLDDPLVASPQTQFLCMDIDSSAFPLYTPNTGEIIRLNNFNILTKRFNPFVSQGKSIFLSKADLYTDYIEDGQIAINVFVQDNSTESVNLAAIGYPQFWQIVFPLDQKVNGITPVDKTWLRFFCHARGQFIQLQFTLNHAQMLNNNINTAPFALHAMILWMGQTGRLISR
jgi:hypothetical protein